MLHLFGKSKKANVVIDTATIIISLFVFSLFILVGYHAFHTMKANLLTQFTGYTESTEIINQGDEKYSKVFDGGFLFVFFGLWMISLIASFMIDTHPVFFIVSIILLVIIVLACAMLGNYFEEFTSTGDFSGYSSDFPMMFYIMNHLLIISIVIGFSIAIVLFGKAAV